MMIMLIFDREGSRERMIILNQFESGVDVTCDRFGVVDCAQ